MQKVVDNFQFDESTQRIENGFQIYTAYHVKTKERYTLKKLQTKGNTDKNSYQGLLNQVSILKQFDHPNIVKCHKMLKTPNSIYLVYEYCSQKTLQSIIQNHKQKVSRAQKQNYVKQICLGVREMKRKRVIHLNLIPSKICISDQGVVKITDFFYAEQIINGTQTEAKIIPPKSEYIAPQLLKQKKAAFSCDAYSFGKILLNLQFYIEQVGGKIIENPQISLIIKGLIKKDPSERHAIEQIQGILLKSKQMPKSRKQMPLDQFYQSNRKVSMNETKSARAIDSPGKSDGKSRNSRSPANNLQKSQSKLRQVSPAASKSKISHKQQTQNTGTFRDIVFKILKIRGLSIFLLNLSKTCSVVVTNNAVSMMLSYLLIKKSTNILTNLLSFLHTGKSEIGIQMNSRQRQQFYKTGDYLKIQAVLNMELNTQKKQLTQMSVAIQVGADHSKMDQKFKYELHSQKQDQQYFKIAVSNYLKSIILDEKAMKLLQKDNLVYLKLMSMVFEYGSFFKLFQDHINDAVLDMEMQQLFVHFRQKDSGQLVESIRAKLKKFNKDLERKQKQKQYI